VHRLHLKTQVSLGDETLGTLVNTLDKVGVNLDSQFFGFFEFFIQNCDTLTDRLVISYGHNALDEIFNIKLFLEP